jgi:hypothetical protein
VNFGTLVEPPTGAFGSPDLTVVVCSSRIREAMVCLNFPSPEEFEAVHACTASSSLGRAVELGRS